MNPKLSFRMFLIAGGWLMMVVCLVRLGEAAAGLWNRQVEDLAAARERLSRLHGWLSVEQEVTARETEALGPLAGADRSELSWVSLEGLQTLAGAQGLSVKELRPSELAGEGKVPGAIRLDLRLEGRLEPMGQFLQQIPDKMPGVRLESLQFLPQEKGQIQALLRLRLPAWERS